MQKPEYVLIDSRDRIMDASQSTSNFLIQFSPSLEHVKSMMLMSISMPLTVFNVDDSNNLIFFSDAALNNYIAVMPVGIYDNINILDSIKLAIETEYPATTITASYDYLTHRFIISSTLQIALDFTQILSIGSMLGFTDGVKPLALSHTAENVSSLSVPEYFFINIDGLHSCRTTNGENATFIVFSNVDSGQVNHFYSMTQYNATSSGGNQPLQTVHIELKRRGNRILNIHNSEWCCLLKVEYWN